MYCIKIIYSPTDEVLSETLVTEQEVRSSHRTTSFSFTKQGLEGLRYDIEGSENKIGYAFVKVPPVPMVNPKFYKVVPGSIIKENDEFTFVWVTVPCDTIQVVAANKIEEINQACAAVICSGYYSAAIPGEAPYFYSSDRDDQQNISGNVLDASMGVSCWHYCYDHNRVRMLLEHTPEQMIQVGRDFKNHKMNAIVKAGELKQRVQAAVEANDFEQLLNITWGDIPTPLE